jgi:hypothetical protein
MHIYLDIASSNGSRQTSRFGFVCDFFFCFMDIGLYFTRQRFFFNLKSLDSPRTRIVELAPVETSSKSTTQVCSPDARKRFVSLLFDAIGTSDRVPKGYRVDG